MGMATNRRERTLGGAAQRITTEETQPGAANRADLQGWAFPGAAQPEIEAPGIAA